MKRFSGLLATIVVIMLSVQTTGCTFQAPSPTATGTPAITTSAAAQTIEQARQQLQDKGFAVVGSMQMASDLASFSVAIPTFVPQGFYAQNYSDSGAYVVDDMNFGLPSSHFK